LVQPVDVIVRTHDNQHIAALKDLVWPKVMFRPSLRWSAFGRGDSNSLQSRPGF
jgi:hypothetical protein